MSAGNHVCSAEYRRLETEGSVNKVQVVVDGFRDTDNGDRLATLLHLFGNGMRAPEGSVAADTEQHVDVQAHEGIHHYGGFLHAARAPQDSTAVILDSVYHVGVQHDRWVTVGWVQPAVTVGDTEDIPHTVVKPQHLNKAFDDVVEAGAEAAAGHDACACPGGVVENRFPRACRF